MATYLVYGKRVEGYYDSGMRKYLEPHKTFRALNYNGERVTKLEEAGSFASKEDAEQWLFDPKKKIRSQWKYEIRKAK